MAQLGLGIAYLSAVIAGSVCMAFSYDKSIRDQVAPEHKRNVELAGWVLMLCVVLLPICVAAGFEPTLIGPTIILAMIIAGGGCLMALYPPENAVFKNDVEEKYKNDLKIAAASILGIAIIPFTLAGYGFIFLKM